MEAGFSGMLLNYFNRIVNGLGLSLEENEN
jgi:hypothetical protein